jgi:hypothetical protein
MVVAVCIVLKVIIDWSYAKINHAASLLHEDLDRLEQLLHLLGATNRNGQGQP